MNLHLKGCHFETQRVKRRITIISFKDNKMSVKSPRFALKNSFSIHFQFKCKQENIFPIDRNVETSFSVHKGLKVFATASTLRVLQVKNFLASTNSLFFLSDLKAIGISSDEDNVNFFHRLDNSSIGQFKR